MRKYSDKTCVVLLVTLCILLINGCVNRIKKSHTSQTEAKVTSVGTGCGSGSTVVKFVYTVNGKSLENWTCFNHSSEMTKNLRTNEQAIACYDPADPEDSSVIPTDYSCYEKQP